ncbi:uncharacterized protein LOC111861616, partial [Cryptotermes secundus]|uniref:uncharacterized protein LOC111861616 n=1 Tax=Cryptotermes secundus TaxID=105785 RepID=UPI000CD7D8E4
MILILAVSAVLHVTALIAWHFIYDNEGLKLERAFIIAAVFLVTGYFFYVVANVTLLGIILVISIAVVSAVLKVTALIIWRYIYGKGVLHLERAFIITTSLMLTSSCFYFAANMSILGVTLVIFIGVVSVAQIVT